MSRCRRSKSISIFQEPLQSAWYMFADLHRSSGTFCALQYAAPFQFVQPFLDGLRSFLDWPNFGDRLSAVGDRDGVPLANLTDHL